MMQPALESQPLNTAGSAWKQYDNAYYADLDIVGGTRFGRYQKISNESTYNMIISDGALVPFAGYEFVSNIGAGIARQVYNCVLADLIIAVIGNGVYTVSSGFTSQRVGSIESYSGNVYISDNLAGQVAIVDGLNVYIYNYNNNTYQTVNVDFAPGYITYQDTFFISVDLNTNQWRLSANSDGTSWPPDAQNVGEIQSKPCRAIAAVALDRILLVMGQTVTEPWYDAGNQLFPYVRNNAYCIDYGSPSTQTIATGFGMAVWLGNNQQSGLAIMVSQDGGVPTPISNDGLDFLFAQIRQPENSFGMLYKLEGHIIYQLTFTSDNHTFIYDFNTNNFFTLTDENLNHHIARRVVFFNGNNYFISFNDGNLYRMTSFINTYNGKSIPRIRIPKNIQFPFNDTFRIKNITLSMESGINVSGAVYDNPGDSARSVFLGQNRVDLTFSRDGGYTWGNTVSRNLPNRGKLKNNVRWFQCGSVQNACTIKFYFVSQGRFVVTGGQIAISR